MHVKHKFGWLLHTSRIEVVSLVCLTKPITGENCWPFSYYMEWLNWLWNLNYGQHWKVTKFLRFSVQLRIWKFSEFFPAKIGDGNVSKCQAQWLQGSSINHVSSPWSLPKTAFRLPFCQYSTEVNTSIHGSIPLQPTFLLKNFQICTSYS